MVTTYDCADTSLVARRGPNSVFFALARCAPAVIRDRSKANRKGISEAELLRALGDSGQFTPFRDRRGVRMSDDPTGAGMCLFNNRRWRNPADLSDLAHLHDQHKRLAKAFPAFAETSVQKLCSTLNAIIAAWERRSAKHCTSVPLCRLASDESMASTVFDSHSDLSSPQPDECFDAALMTCKRQRLDGRGDKVSPRSETKARTDGPVPVQHLIQAEHVRNCVGYSHIGDCVEDEGLDFVSAALQRDPLCTVTLWEMSPIFNSWDSLQVKV